MNSKLTVTLTSLSRSFLSSKDKTTDVLSAQILQEAQRLFAILRSLFSE